MNTTARHLTALLLITPLVAGSLAGCAARVAVRGNLPDPEQVAAVLPGQSSRQDVQRILGSPSTLSTFQANTWYYIGERTEQIAFFRPDVIDRSVLVITFKDDGTVDDTKLYTVEDGQEIAMVDRTTPTEGNELTIWQQLIGNIGRFGSDSGIKKPGST
ncbi:Beta-barrel assembly machine subunit BamE [Tistlia consotensis]|uniref:Beta-barrel assembly machine subunit BamE n=1 Tax=Tistlia consotensis USBA 355 TaxID=560819 RepID=A0A1Y6C9J5_9PROT|nr:outer membrane protein assembly factor BamE [Tistlia consotensis]SMF43354.1 Beta-barrel assembly machine subunit BamE [Tistlia consotensis USBA 355]SNR42488.1 Beta-barrel assembly machine subunit BamE [Tistlia consotensis]